ncbi:DNA polymerase beta superfamily protein [Clostridium lundense]|uniref:DNA polymerase beta superfamily protein n=1 Tax=Clostridium lundense TaxID=319475 RepID=UPI00047FF03A|nr:nucleotidyltransferase domain-containing protein [Clostridium lundense]
MNIDKIKEKLNSNEYGFLRNNSNLNNNIILLTLGGSYSYGLNDENSDIDIRGIACNTREEILTMKCRDKPYEDRETDTVIYTLSQIIELLCNCNPNTIEILGCKEDHYFVLKREGRLLKDNANIFLSQKAISSFSGYANSQLRRLENALARDSYSKKEKEKHILETINSMFLKLSDRFKDIKEENKLHLYIDKSQKETYEEEIFMDIILNRYPLRDFKNIYSDIFNIINDYDKLNHRNNKKDKLHLNKHISHLFRLYIMGTEILEEKGINTYREEDRGFLLDLKNGKYVTKKANGEDDYSFVFDLLDPYIKRFNYAKEHTNLPENPNMNEVNDLVMEINRSVLKSD